MAVDLWDGSSSLLDNYRLQTGVSYPIFMNGHAGGVETDYDCESSFVFVVGGDGVILYRGFFVDAEVRAAVAAGLAALSPSPVPAAGGPIHAFAGARPNPFNPVTNLSFTVAAGAATQQARMEILDLRGRLVQVVFSGEVSGGRSYKAAWNGQDRRGTPSPSGIYLSRLRIGSWSQTRPLTLVK